MPHWSGDEGSDVYGGEDILPRSGLDESLHVLEHSVLGTIGPGEPWCGTGEAVETPRETEVHSECRDAIRGTLEEVQIYVSGRPSVGVGIVFGNRYVPYPPNLCRNKFTSLIGGLRNTVLCLTRGLLPLICALRG